MQYTGLKDKNGKHEIYEEDIVRSRSYVNDIEEWEVRWSEPNSGFWCGTSHPLTKGYAEECEIIGNIYENPGLVP